MGTMRGVNKMGIKDKYQDYFEIGVAVNNRTIRTHSELIKKHFNSLTFENESKFSSLQKSEGKYKFKKLDELVSFGRENKMSMRGHTFTWHQQTPNWVFKNATKEILLERLKSHIEVVGKRYEDDFYCWDVVNEAIDDKGDGILRKSFWTDIIGQDFMEYAFHYAREVLPSTELFYNDYNESLLPKRDKIYKTVKDMKDKGVPINGVGLQCHWNIYQPSMDEIRRAIEVYADLGLRIHITEMDISVYRFEDKQRLSKPTEKMLEQQAKVYGDSFAIFREYKDLIDNVTLWGPADDVTWLDNFPVRKRKNWPLLFDENQEPKEAYYRIMDF